MRGSTVPPISLLSLVSKVLERVVHNALMEHVLEHNLVSDRQFGFRPGSSTQEAILTATNSWYEALERKQSVGCVFFQSVAGLRLAAPQVGPGVFVSVWCVGVADCKENKGSRDISEEESTGATSRALRCGD